MQSSKNGELVSSETGDLKGLMTKGGKELSAGKADKVTIVIFHEGETIELRGLKFKISSINQKAKRLTLKLL